jgi:hypothetical protein
VDRTAILTVRLPQEAKDKLATLGGPFVRHEDAMDYLEALARGGEEPALPRTFRTR